MPVKGCGVDLIEISRIARALEKKAFRERVYTAREREYLRQRGACSWAVRFAAKEAVMKSLGRGWLQGVSFQDIEICSDKWGQPNVALRNGALEVARNKGVERFALSLSHSRELALAYAIALGEG